MAEAKKYNNFSPKLKEEIPTLKRGETIRFQLEGIHYCKVTKKFICAKSKRLIKVDRIWDPWVKKRVGAKSGEDQYDGDYVDIAFIIRETPGKQDSLRDTIVDFGSIEFTNTFAGIIEIRGGNRSDEKMLPFLFFCNRNATNKGKEWFIKPPGKPMYHEIKTTEKAKTDLAAGLKVDQAKSIITNFSKEEVYTAAAGLMPHRHNTMTHEEKILAMRVIATNTPLKILDLSKDVEVQTTALIEQFLKAHLIVINLPKGVVQWADDKSMICMIKPGQTPHNSLKRYFMTEEGLDVLQALEKLLAKSKASDKDKTEKAVV